MELAQIIKWVTNTHKYLGDPNTAENAREYNEEHGYLLEYEQYIYALTGHFLKMDTNNKKAFVKRLFRDCDNFIEYLEFVAEEHKEECNECSCEWVYYLADEIYFDDVITHEIDNALFVDLLKFYCEVIWLCFESELDPVRLSSLHKDIINDLAEFLRLGDKECDESDKIKRVPRIDRIVAVKLLLEKAGVRGIDRTRLASFVEAVTGGNSATAPKDTYTYRYYNAKDTSGGIELLRTIGIEVK